MIPVLLVKEWSLKNSEVKVKEIFDLDNATNESQIKGEQQLKFLTELVKMYCTKFDEHEADHRKKDETVQKRQF